MLGFEIEKVDCHFIWKEYSTPEFSYTINGLTIDVLPPSPVKPDVHDQGKTATVDIECKRTYY